MSRVPKGFCPAPLGHYANQKLVGLDGLYSLWYFDNPAEANALAEVLGGYVVETSPGEIWRVTLKNPARAGALACG